jgi:hypothetical protein
MRRIALLAAALSIAGCSQSTIGTAPVPIPTSSPAGLTCREPAARAPVPNAVHGLMVWLYSVDETKKQPDILKYLRSDRALCGASIVVQWSEVDKGPNAPRQYDFTAVERAMKPWIAAKKTVNLLFAGTNEIGSEDTATPAWVLAQTGRNRVRLIPCKDPGNGLTAPPTPVYWQSGYAVPWRRFITAAIARYGNDPDVGYMRFGLGAGAEDFPQHGADGNCFAAWQPYGLSARFWARFSSRLVGFIAADARRHHSKVEQLVALNPFSDPARPFDVAGEVADVAAAHGVGFGTENLGSGPYGWTVEPCTPREYWCRAFQTHVGQVPLEFQPINFTLQPGTHIAPLPKLLRYGVYNGAQVFEIYPQDWLTADDPGYPTYAAHHVAWKKGLMKAAALLGGS